jgi:hypothetical protein
MTKDNLKDWETIYEWARSKDPEEIIGCRSTMIHSPFVACFESLMSGLVFEVRRSWVGAWSPRACSHNPLTFRPPYWMRQAIRAIHCDSAQQEGEVTAKDFATILETVSPLKLVALS